MKITNYEKDQAWEVAALWNRRAPLQGYSCLSEKEFSELVVENPYFNSEYAFTAEEDGRVCGFICGACDASLPGGALRGYFTCLLLDEGKDDEESAKLLLAALERAFACKGAETCDVLFFNPMRLPWPIPGTPGHLHNNAPGLWVESRQYGWFLRQGYAERSREIAYYLKLQAFSLPERQLGKQEELKRMGYHVGIYNSAGHRGLEEMLEKLGNPVWQQEMLWSAQEGIPFLAAVWKGQVVGFAGPVYPERSGRGYFTGIGVVGEHEGKGLGSLLFYRLCQEEEKAGAAYMSLFTGVNNPAAKIYRGAGFLPVREFAIMRKVF